MLTREEVIKIFTDVAAEGTQNIKPWETAIFLSRSIANLNDLSLLDLAPNEVKEKIKEFTILARDTGKCSSISNLGESDHTDAFLKLYKLLRDNGFVDLDSGEIKF